MKSKELIEYAKKFLGIPYKFGGTSPSTGFDCSGFVQYVYKNCLGINIRRTTKEQINDGFEVKKEDLLPGDLVFPNNHHVTLYIGNNQVIHAPQPNDHIKISKLWSFWRARRIISENNNNSNQNNNSIHNNNSNHNNNNYTYGEFIFNLKTPLEKTGKNCSFLLGDYNKNGILDLYCIKKNNTLTKSTEVHILDGSNNYQSFLLQSGTCLHETGNNCSFLLGDYNKNGKLDLYCIKKNKTGTNSTEVHILDGSNNYQSFLLQTGTCLHETGNNFEFGLGDFNNNGTLDLYCIKKYDTGNNNTEIHILNGSDNFQSFLYQNKTELFATDDNYSFGISDYNNNGHPDIYCIKKFDETTNTFEVHILNGENNYQSYLFASGNSSLKLNEDYVFFPYKNKLYCIKKKDDIEVACYYIKKENN